MNTALERAEKNIRQADHLVRCIYIGLGDMALKAPSLLAPRTKKNGFMTPEVRRIGAGWASL